MLTKQHKHSMRIRVCLVQEMYLGLVTYVCIICENVYEYDNVFLGVFIINFLAQEK